MNKRHHYLPLQSVIADMVLADNLLDKLGHVLLPAGTCLTPAMIASMHHHDVHQLSILIDDTSEPEPDAAISLQVKMQRLDSLFRHAEKDGPIAKLLAYLQKYRLEEAQ
ncbi:hypothetical protein [Undibacterium parvum]|uniref:Uncharacterized protein n=1 Tax=Undibacterium parvum TaxID=401471 RepID=A0A3S9HG06_9BURK|nr:hypothetical protein [Undibacterium parvum]AZP11029.1 hypothetical protein EJN92_02765 [Undibacterium parvum]